MLSKLGEYIKKEYKLNIECDIDLKIYSSNIDEFILVTTLEDKVYIKYSDITIESNYKNMYKDIRFILDNLIYIYLLDLRGDIIRTIIYQNDSDKTLFEEVEDFIWRNKKDINVEKILAVTFANNYSFEANVSGVFIDTFWEVFDTTRYNVINASLKKFRYRDKENYLINNSILLKKIIKNKVNLKEIKKYFLSLGYAFLIDAREDNTTVYQVIDIDFDNFKSIAGNKYLVMSADLNSIIYYTDDNIYIHGLVCDVYKTFFKILQIDEEPCNYVHNIKTSRVVYKEKIYEATGRSISEELNNLTSLVNNKMMCCFNCKYGNYIDNENEIYCLKGFKPRDFSDVLYIIDEAKIIPYDQFNLCEDFSYQTKEHFTHTLSKFKVK